MRKIFKNSIVIITILSMLCSCLVMGSENEGILLRGASEGQELVTASENASEGQETAATGSDLLSDGQTNEQPAEGGQSSEQPQGEGSTSGENNLSGEPAADPSGQAPAGTDDDISTDTDADSGAGSNGGNTGSDTPLLPIEDDGADLTSGTDTDKSDVTGMNQGSVSDGDGEDNYDAVVSDEAGGVEEEPEADGMMSASGEQEIVVELGEEVVYQPASYATNPSVYETPAMLPNTGAFTYTYMENEFECYLASNPVKGRDVIAVITGLHKEESNTGEGTGTNDNGNGSEATSIVLEIPEEVQYQDVLGSQDLRMYRVMYIKENAFADNTDITEVRFQFAEPQTDAVKGISIGSYAFKGCTRLAKVTLRKDLFNIKYGAFLGCTSLKELNDIPRILDGSMTEYTVLDHSGNGITVNIGQDIFKGCTSLTNDSDDGSSVTFANDITAVPKYLFYGCASLKKMDLSGYVQMTEVQNYAFYGCSGLTELTLPGAPSESSQEPLPEGILRIGNCAFYGCSALNDFTMPANLTSIGDSAFYGCSTITEALFPEKLNMIGYSAFSYCSSLKKLYLPKSLDNSSDRPSTIRTNIFSNTAISGKSNDNSSIQFEEGFSTIPNNLFYGCRSLASITLPGTVTEIQDYAFYQCEILNNIDFSNVKNNIKNNISEDFKFTSVGNYAFYGCESLREIGLPSTLISIGVSAFNGCKTLYRLNSGSTTGSNAVNNTGDESGFGSYSSLITIGANAFEGCVWLIDVHFPESLKTIGNYAFAKCNSISAIYITKTLSESTSSIGTYVFYDCRSLDSITLASYEPGMQSFPSALMYGADFLKTVYIPEGFTSIGKNAFYNCNQLRTVIVPWSVETIGAGAFSGTKLSGTEPDDNSVYKKNGFYGYKGSFIEEYCEIGFNFYSFEKNTGTNPYQEKPLQNISLELVGADKLPLYQGQEYKMKDLYKIHYTPEDTTSDHTVKWSCSDPNVVRLVDSDKGSLKALSQGTVTMTATSNYSSAISANCQIGVVLPPSQLTSVSVTPSSISGLVSGGQMKLECSCLPADASQPRVIWSSSNDAVLSVDQEGYIRAGNLESGSTTVSITAASEYDKNVKGTCWVTVRSGKLIESISADTSETLFVDKNRSVYSNVNVLPDDAANKTLTWKSDNTSIATVSNGYVTGVSVGETTIHAYATDGSEKETSLRVKVLEPVTRVSLSETSKTMNLGSQANLTATVYPSNATDQAINWRSDNESVATVNNGWVTAVGKGSCRIWATSSRYTNQYSYCTVTVKVPVSSVSLNTNSLSLIQGTTSRLTATVLPSNADNKNVAWSSNNTSVATVSGGTVRAVSAGTAVITVTTSDGNHAARCTVTVTAKNSNTSNSSSSSKITSSNDEVVSDSDSAGSVTGGGTGSADISSLFPAGDTSLGGLITIPKTPSGFKAKSKKGKINLSWKALKKKTKSEKALWKQIKGVEIQYSTNTAFSQPVTKRTGKNTKKYVLKGLKKGTTYYVRIRYYDGIGYSKWTAIKTAKA